MSPRAENLLNKAYQNYIVTNSKHFSIIPSGKTHLDLVDGARQLLRDGYIENLSDSATLNHIPDILAPIEFDITEIGLKYKRLNGKL